MICLISARTISSDHNSFSSSGDENCDAILSFGTTTMLAQQKKTRTFVRAFSFLTYAAKTSGAMKERSGLTGLPEPTLQFRPVKEPGSL